MTIGPMRSTPNVRPSDTCDAVAATPAMVAAAARPRRRIAEADERKRNAASPKARNARTTIVNHGAGFVEGIQEIHIELQCTAGKTAQVFACGSD